MKVYYKVNYIHYGYVLTGGISILMTWLLMNHINMREFF